jgi:ABC-type phosphonate transport system ATPase subunit
MTDARRPVHLVVLLGATAGIYAVSLAGVTALQSAADRAHIDDGAPLDATTSSLSAGQDAFERDLASAARAYGDAAAGYDRLAPRLDELEISLDTLAGTVAKVSGAAKALPARVALPTVTHTMTTRAAPATHATTGASGG